MWEKDMKEGGFVYMYNRISLLYSRNDYNLVNQPYFNKTLKRKKKKSHTHRNEITKAIKRAQIGVPFMAQWLMNPSSIHEDAGSIPGLAQWVKHLALPCTVV